MAGKQGRSGPPQNLNAVRHGRQAWLKRRALPVHLSHVKSMVLREEREVTTDLGGDANITAMERAIVRDNGTALGLILLSLEEAKTKGCIAVDPQGRWDLQPGLQRIRALIDSRRMGFVALGLGRRSRDVTPSLQDLLTEAASDGEDNGGGG